MDVPGAQQDAQAVTGAIICLLRDGVLVAGDHLLGEEILEHHRRRLAEAAAALGPEPRSAYDVSVAIFGENLDASGRRFALAETLAHLERLVREGRAVRQGDAYTDS